MDRFLRLASLLVLLLLLWPCSASPGQDKKPEKKEGPRVIMVEPLGITPGSPTKLTIRGMKLDTVSAVRFPDARVAVKVLHKGKAPLPKPELAPQMGDTQVEAEVTVPPGVPESALSFIVATAAGDTPPHQLILDGGVPAIAEKEPNNSFRQAQPIQVPQLVEGTIQQNDVDVFRLEGQAGQRLVCEVLAARRGSALDSLLTLYDAQGRELATGDDMEGSTDSRLEITLPQTGTCYLVLMDANDQGGPAHPYQLIVRPR